MTALEARADDHSERIRNVEKSLADGRVDFAEIRKDLAAIQAAIVDVRAAVSTSRDSMADKVRDAAIFWAVPLVGGSILWAIVRSGQVPGVTQ